MNYVDDACMDSFTPGQIERMQDAWEMFRADGGESCACALETSSKSKKSEKSKKSSKSDSKSSSSVRGRRELNESVTLTRELRKNMSSSSKKSKSSSKSSSSDGDTYNTQAYDDVDETSNIPTCNGVAPSTFVKLFEYEGKGDDVTVTVMSANAYTTLTVLEGSCGGLRCVTASQSPAGALIGNSEVTFEAEKGETYYIAVSTKEVPEEFSIEFDD